MKKNKRVTIRITEDVFNNLRKEAERLKITISELIREKITDEEE